MKIVNIILGLMFIGFSVSHLNNPNPLTWIVIYGTMAGVCFLANFNNYSRPLMILQAAAYTIYAIILFPGLLGWLNSSNRSLLFDELAKAQFPYIQETREFMGLLTCLAVLMFYWKRSGKLTGNK